MIRRLSFLVARRERDAPRDTRSRGAAAIATNEGKETRRTPRRVWGGEVMRACHPRQSPLRFEGKAMLTRFGLLRPAIKARGARCPSKFDGSIFPTGPPSICEVHPN